MGQKTLKESIKNAGQKRAWAFTTPETTFNQSHDIREGVRSKRPPNKKKRPNELS